MVATVRGGIPVVRRVDVPVGGQKLRLPFYLMYLKVRNTSGNPGRIYFTEEDFNNDANYIEVPVAGPSYPNGQWEGPVETSEGPRADLWLRGVTGTSSLEIVLFQRRG